MAPCKPCVPTVVTLLKESEPPCSVSMSTTRCRSCQYQTSLFRKCDREVSHNTHRDVSTFPTSIPLSQIYHRGFPRAAEMLPSTMSVDETTTPPSSWRLRMPRTPPSKASTSYDFKFGDTSSDSDLSDAPEDIGPYPFNSPLPSPSIKSEGNSAYGQDLKGLQEDIEPDPFDSPLPSPSIESREYAEYEEDFNMLQELLASAKEAFDTPNFSQQVEAAAKLDIALEVFDKKWPGRLPDADIISESCRHSLYQDLSSSNDDSTSESCRDSLYQELSSSDDDTNDSSLGDCFPCPYASTYHCTEIFEVESAAIAHSTVHTATSGKYLCPYSSCYDCPKTFSTLHSARQHGDAVHLELKPFPCPYATGYACNKFFSQLHSAKEHGYTHTGEKPHPCPYAAEYGCSKFFSQSYSANEHGYIHTGEKNHPCPYAAEYGCSRFFSQSHSAKEHGKTHIKKDEDGAEIGISMSTPLIHTAS